MPIMMSIFLGNAQNAENAVVVEGYIIYLQLRDKKKI